MRSLLLRAGVVCTLSLMGLGNTATLAWPNTINHQFRDYQFKPPIVGHFELGPWRNPLVQTNTADLGKPTKVSVFSHYHWSSYVCGRAVYYYIDSTNPFNSSCQIDPSAMDDTLDHLLDKTDSEEQNDFSSGL